MKPNNRLMNLLLVDDDPEILETLSGFLLESFPSAKLDTCLDGEAALSVLAQKKYDVICTDYKMPKVSGVELVNAIRAGSGLLNSETPVIFISAFQNDVKDQIHSSDNVFYINKPFNMENLVLYVDSAMLSAHINLIDLNNQLINSHNQLLQNQFKLIQSAKLTSLGDMSAGIAHELNNPLTAIEGYALILEKETDEKSVKEKVAKITAAVGRMKKVVAHLRVFSRQNSTNDWRPFDINRSIDDALIFVEEQLKIEEIVYERNLDRKVAPMFGDSNLIEGVFLNLIMNSRDAFINMPRSSKQKRIKISTLLHDEKTIEVRFEDNAGGIPPELHGRVFEPFFTTKPEGLGFGLGLSSVYGAVKQHFGQIDLESEAGRGCLFTIRFPVCADGKGSGSAVESKEESADRSKQNHKAKVLIIDDEEDICDILSSYLEGVFIVETESNPHAACEKIAKTRYDLVLSDLKMPKISGVEVVKAVHQVDPTTPVVIMSAHLMTLKDIGIDGKRDNVHFLMKPFGSPDKVVDFLQGIIRAKIGKATGE